ncbi:PREDICTED: probable inactive leucine-rich repeat receptor-like protein kinase At3g03770 [Lupinus angustifolius]|nr:PREDICTED: probable inactive leucine-rich repeat receptor-like protein kinase At3g03770 [Lupinus angustifolius]XP_019417687.1 PREDICTED: probable inactive leucine-rich repeat receptor-like protein kinase At3g03770 [Lupinus angustifolius]
MGFHYLVLLFCSIWIIFSMSRCNSQLQSSQTEVLLQLKKHLEYPKQLEIWKDRWTELCSISSSAQVNVSCKDNFVTGLIILGDKPTQVRGFDGFSIPNQTLSQSFSVDSFVATLSRLTNLRVLSLVSLGIWGPLPDRIHRLFALEHLDLSSNYLYGSIPPKISTLVNLKTLTLGDNFFNDTIPTLFNSSSNLKVLILKNNRLKGPFPSSILSITTLTYIDMSRNQISGSLQGFTGLSSLEQLDLSNNRFDSSLPSMPKALIRLSLSRNSFSGEIPKHYGQLINLQQLDVSFNSLTGTTPAEIFTLPNITYLNFASNILNGSLQNHISCSNQLKFVDISYNKLVGVLPYCMSNKSKNRVVKSDGNCLSGNVQHQHAVPYCTETHVMKKSYKVGIFVGAIVGVLMIIVVLALCIVVAWRRYFSGGMQEQHLLHKTVQDNYSAGFSSDLVTNARYVSETAKLGREDFPVCRSYSLEELKEATNNFDNSTFMGENLYGKLYKGKLESGIQVVIRRLPLSKKYSIRNFKLRLDLLAKLRHPHLMSFLGHCIDGVIGEHNDTKVYLVYECVSNGTFQNYLSANSSGKIFNWPERLSVLVSIAKAVHFLHTGMIPGFFKNRLKINNILLNQHWMAKLSDYGLSIISEETDACGVTGESPNSWQMKKLEDDVYSFGFILLEALVGPSGSAKREAALLSAMASFSTHQDGWKQIVDPVVQATCCKESVFIVISITNKIISPESWSRPSIEDVLWNLQYASQVQATADGE